MKKSLFVFALFASLMTLPSSVSAQDEIRKIMVDLKAKGFSQTNYVDNLESSNIIFAPGDKFQLQLNIKNEGNRNQTNVLVKQVLPGTIVTDSPVEFTIPQIVAGENYIKNITVTIKDKALVNKALSNNSLRFTARSEAGTEGSDYLTFYTNNGTKEATPTGTQTKGGVTLPKTGAAETLLFGSALASALAFAGMKLRAFARGY